MNGKKYEPRYGVLSLGRGGIAGNPPAGACPPGEKWSSSIPDMRLRPYFGELVEGGVVVDTTGVDFGDMYEVAINGPMLDVDLADEEVSVCPPLPALMMLGLEGEYQILAAIKIAPPAWRGLDHVSLAVWLEMRRAVGARIGRRVGESVVWEDGTVEGIPPFAQRRNDTDVEVLK